MTDLPTLATTAQKTADSAAQAAAELAAAHRADYEARQQAHRATWQAWADAYDPAALRADIAATEADLRHAVATSDLGRALVAHLAAKLRFNAQYGLRGPAHAAGAELAKGPDQAEMIGDALEFVVAMLGPMVHDTARATVDAETDAIVDQAQAVLDAATGPVAYRLEVARRDDYHDDNLGGRSLTFTDGRAWCRADDPLADAVRRLDGYQVVPLFGPEYAAAVALDAASPRPADTGGPS